MTEAMREFAIARTRELLRAYTRKIEEAKMYLEYIPRVGREIVENYDNNVGGQRTLLLKACESEDFFSGMSDEMVLAYADVCNEMNALFDLNVEHSHSIKSLSAGENGVDNLREVADFIPSKYYPRAQAALARMPKEQRQKVVKYIGELFGKYEDRKKTMQAHHWIEQSRIKNTKKYPFLGCPPMKEDLLKSEKNLSLIVGHNGGHKKTYNDLLDEKLGGISRDLKLECLKRNISLDKLLQNDNIKRWVGNSVEKIITEMQDAVKRDHTILNNVEKMFILD